MAVNKADDIFDDIGSDESPFMRWREYVNVLVDRKWILITTFFAVMVCAVIWNVRQVPMYRSSATLHVDMFASKILDLPDPFSAGTPAYMFDQYINTQIKALKSRIFIEKVVESLKDSKKKEAAVFLENSPSPVDAILSCMSVEPVENSRLVKITVQHRVPEVTAMLANAVVQQFIQQDLNRRMNASLSAVQWLREQADDQKDKIEKAEQAIQDYREQSKMVSLEQKQDIVTAKLKSVSESLTDAETRLVQAQTRMKKVSSTIKEGIPLSEIAVVAGDPLVSAAKKKVSELSSEIDSLKLRYKSKHPKLIKAVTARDDIVRDYQKELTNALQRINAEYEQAKSDVDALRMKLKDQERQALKLSRMMVEYNTLKRNVETDRQLYQSVLVRMKETDLAGKLETTNLRISDLASVPKAPFKPNKPRNIMVAACAGLFLGIFLVLLVNMMDDRVRRVEDFEDSLGVPVLAMIPKVDMDNDCERAAVSFINQESAAAEAFRGFYASLMLDKVSQDAKVIMVVSANASEGKSLVSSNFASVFAQNGKKTLLIDADLRRPVQHKLFKINGVGGLPELVMGWAKFKDVVVRTSRPGLDVLIGKKPSSSSDYNPVRLIASSAMDKLLKTVRRKYDRVIVDCPPLFGVSDPLVLLPKVDGVVFVSLYNKTHRRAAEEACHKLMGSGTPFLGAVINGVELNSHSYYYHRYGYNHYYGNPKNRNP